MAWNFEFPYTDSSRMNNDWILRTIKELIKEIENFVNLNTIKYADPIEWDITRQYEANTVVVDARTGNAYISTHAVPAGVQINNTEYWTQIYNYADIVDTVRAQIATNEGDTTTASQRFNVGDWVFVSGLLYEVIAPMIAGDSFVVDSNVKKVTVEELVKALITVINNEIEARQDADADLQTAIDDEILARQNADSAIEDDVLALENVVNNLDINHVYNQSTPDSGLTTNIGLKEGVYNITSDTVINAQLIVPQGAILNIASGVTLAINGQILAGRYQIFSGAGSVVVNNAMQPFGYPEWFGAIVNDSNVDNAPAILKCFNTFSETLLTSGDYYLQTTLKLEQSNRTIRGVHRLDWSFANADDKGTRLVCESASRTILQIGTDSKPNQINDFVQNISVEDLTVFRDVTNYAFTNNSVNILVQYVLRSKFEYVSSMNSDIGFDIVASVYCHFIKCKAFTTVTEAGDNTRTIRGFRIPETEEIGVAGSNASIYIQDCSATVGGGIIYNASFGVQCYGSVGCSDLFIEGLEVGGMNYGVMIEAPNALNEANDIHITNCVFDGMGQAGVLLVNFAGNGVCNIQGNYVAPSSSGAADFSCYRLVGCTGAISLVSNQAICSPKNSAYGIKLETCAGVVSVANMITESLNAINVTGCAACEFNDSIINRIATGALDAVLLVQSSHCKAECAINGGNEFFTNAYRTYQSAACEVNVTKVITSAVTNFMTEDATVITETGLTAGNNYVSGIML